MWTKIVGQALLPLNLAFELGLVGFVLRRRRWRRLGTTLAVLGLALLWAASTPVVADALAGAVEGRYPPVAVEATPSADVIVVLGGSVAPVRPPMAWPDLTGAADRPLHAARLYRAGKARAVVVSGGSGEGLVETRPECSDVADLLVEWGVPREAIIEDPVAADTRGNALATIAVLEAHGWKRVLLVTSALHMPRALAAFRAVGIDATPCPTDYSACDAERRTLLDWLPDSGALAKSSATVHELLGWLWYRVRGDA